MMIGRLGILGIVVITGVLLGCLVPLAALAVALVVLVLQQGDQNSVFSSNPLDSPEEEIDQVMGAVFEEAVREAVGQGR